jgi:hypothetical protein
MIIKKYTKKEQLIKDLEAIKLMSERELFNYSMQNGHHSTGRMWRDFNEMLKQNGIKELRLVTAKTLKELGRKIPSEADLNVSNPHFKKAGAMKLYLLECD